MSTRNTRGTEGLAVKESVGITVPVYGPDVKRLSSYLNRIDRRLNPERIHIEVDDPSDQEVERLRRLPGTIAVAPKRRGKGAAITAGFEALDTDILAFVDADGSSAIESVGNVIECTQCGNADLVVGSRRHPDATVTAQQMPVRKHLGAGFSWLARSLLSPELYDYQCGAKALTRSAWELLREYLYESGFAWDIELTAIADALDLQIREIPVSWCDQPGSTVPPIRTSFTLGRALLVARSRAKSIRGSRLHGWLSGSWNDRRPLVETAVMQNSTSANGGELR